MLSREREREREKNNQWFNDFKIREISIFNFMKAIFNII